MATQYDVNLEKCALLKCVCVCVCVCVCGEWKLNSAPSRTGTGALKISDIFGYTDKSSLIHLSNL